MTLKDATFEGNLGIQQHQDMESDRLKGSGKYVMELYGTLLTLGVRIVSPEISCQSSNPLNVQRIVW